MICRMICSSAVLGLLVVAWSWMSSWQNWTICWSIIPFLWYYVLAMSLVFAYAKIHPLPLSLWVNDSSAVVSFTYLTTSCICVQLFSGFLTLSCDEYWMSDATRKTYIQTYNVVARMYSSGLFTALLVVMWAERTWLYFKPKGLQL